MLHRFMKPENLLSSLVAIYPPEGSSVERAGYLPGERAPAGDVSPRMVRLPSGLLQLQRRSPLCLDSSYFHFYLLCCDATRQQ